MLLSSCCLGSCLCTWRNVNGPIHSAAATSIAGNPHTHSALPTAPCCPQMLLYTSELKHPHTMPRKDKQQLVDALIEK